MYEFKKIDLIKNEINISKKRGDIKYSEALEGHLHVMQSSIISIKNWYSSLNEIFGFIGLGIALGVYGIYVDGKYLIALLCSILSLIIMMINSADRLRTIAPFMMGTDEESKDEIRARKFFKDVIIGSPFSPSYWRSTLPYFLGFAAICLVGAISCYSLVEALKTGNVIEERAINPLALINNKEAGSNSVLKVRQ